MNNTVNAEKLHIGFFGMRNAGKSSLVNSITNQNISIVSSVKGTTTDPVKKAMELLPLGPVVIVDTPGLDDEGELGELRIEKAKRVLYTINIAILVVDSIVGKTKLDEELIANFKEKNLPYIVVYNKCDLLEKRENLSDNEIYVSSVNKENIEELKEKIGEFAKDLENRKRIVGDLLETGDIVVLVIPIDESAPKGRLILPQQQTMRDILDSNCSFVACQETELEATLNALSKKPKLVITDSQVFEKVAKIVPENILLTSFSILFARYKGNLEELVKGAEALKNLSNNSKVLIAEGCTHHRQCNDIGTVKMPKWIEEFTGSKPQFTFTSGTEFPSDVSNFELIIHCGGCMVTEQEMKYRMETAKKAKIPMVNYGIAISTMHGILERSLKPFQNISHKQ